MTNWLACDKPIEQPTTGRLRTTCNNACRQRALRLRQRNADELDRITPVIMVGDNLEHLASIADQSVDVISIDPPYNVSKADWDKLGSAVQYRSFLAPRLTECKRVLKPTGNLFCFGVQPWITQAQLELEVLDMYFKNYIVCTTTQGGNNGEVLTRRHEDLLFYTKSKQSFFDLRMLFEEREPENKRSYKGVNYEDKRVSDVWSFSPVDSASDDRTGHPTQKPLKLMDKVLSFSCPAHGVVLDCFGGSGSTSVAAIHRQLASIYIERDPVYVEMAQARFKKALLEVKIN